MSRTLSLITLTILCLTVLLSGCGTGEDDALTSLVLPIDFAPSLMNTLAQDGFAVTVTITAPDMEDITRVRNIASIPRDDEAREIVINNIPVGFNRTITIEISKDGEVLFDGSGTVNLSVGGENRVDIALRSLIPIDIPISERIIGTWRLTNTEAAGLLATFRPNGTFIQVVLGVFEFVGEYRILGNQITWIVEGEEGTGIVEINDGQMAITYPVGTEIYERVVD
ncbi:hypothetical protein IH992_20480 [Candidatus Poribacteria bacterium]|nr:hypothetical protein [Candidatus Poribacteria bacterium]